MKSFVIIFLLCVFAVSLFSFELTGNPKSWYKSDLIGFDKIGDSKFGDISSVYLHNENQKSYIRITFNDMIKRQDNRQFNDRFKDKDIR